MLNEGSRVPAGIEVKAGRPDVIGGESRNALRKDVAIREKLAAADPENTKWQEHLSSSYIGLADLLRDQGRIADATEIYGKSLPILEQLVARDPQNLDWQVALLVSKQRVANMLRELWSTLRGDFSTVQSIF